jgi:hypothetical protein
MGSPAVAAWIAQIAFVVLIVAGRAELGLKRIAIFSLLWLAGFFARSFLGAYGPGLFPPYVAVLDIVLVFLVYHGDVKLT